MFVGNKCDLEQDRVISKDQGAAIAQELGGGRIGHHETSAKSNINVTSVRYINITAQLIPRLDFMS